LKTGKQTFKAFREHLENIKVPLRLKAAKLHRKPGSVRFTFTQVIETVPGIY